jgi:hypothetical protein
MTREKKTHTLHITTQSRQCLSKRKRWCLIVQYRQVKIAQVRDPRLIWLFAYFEFIKRQQYSINRHMSDCYHCHYSTWSNYSREGAWSWSRPIYCSPSGNSEEAEYPCPSSKCAHPWARVGMTPRHYRRSKLPVNRLYKYLSERLGQHHCIELKQTNKEAFLRILSPCSALRPQVCLPFLPQFQLP